MIEFQRKFYSFDGHTLSYLFHKGSTRRLIVVFPPGFRDAQYFVNNHNIFNNEDNVIVFDLLGRGLSSDPKSKLDYLNSNKQYINVILNEGFTLGNTILVGKSFSTPIIESILRANDGSFNKSVIVARTLSNIDFSYYDWRKKSGWIYWSFLMHLNEVPIYPRLKTPTNLLFNTKDEIIPEYRITQINEIFENSKVRYLQQNSHWGAVTEDLVKTMKELVYS